MKKIQKLREQLNDFIENHLEESLGHLVDGDTHHLTFSINAKETD